VACYSSDSVRSDNVTGAVTGRNKAVR